MVRPPRSRRLSAGDAENRSSAFHRQSRVCSARTPAECVSGTAIGMRSSTKRSTRLPAHIVAGSFRASVTPTANTAHGSAWPTPDGKAVLLMDKDYQERLIDYRTTMALVEGMLRNSLMRTPYSFFPSESALMSTSVLYFDNTLDNGRP